MDVKPRGAPIAAYFAAPLGVMAFAYLIDIIFGAKFVIFPGSLERGIERFALVTVGACTLELVIAAFLLLRPGRVAAFAAIAAYLLVISFLALMFGTFQA